MDIGFLQRVTTDSGHNRRQTKYGNQPKFPRIRIISILHCGRPRIGEPPGQCRPHVEPAIGRTNFAFSLRVGGRGARNSVHGTAWPTSQALYLGTAGGPGIVPCETDEPTAAQQSPQQPARRYQARIGTAEIARRRTMVMTVNHEDLPVRHKHEGVRVGEIIAYRAWRVLINSGGRFRRGEGLDSLEN